MEGFQGTIGTVSSGTLRTADLIAAFADELEAIEPQRIILSANRRLILKAKACSMMSSGADQELEEYAQKREGDSSMPQWLLDNLVQELEDHAPEGYWFGNTEGDPTVYGFWEDHSSCSGRWCEEAHEPNSRCPKSEL